MLRLQEMIKAIIFDITGVIFPFQPWVDERPSKDRLMEIKQIASSVYDKGKISKDYLRKEIFQVNRPKRELEAIYNSLTVIDKNIFNLIKRLSETYSLYCIANEASKWTNIREDLYDFEKYFKKLYISVEVGMRKPEEGIYNLFLKETGFTPEECLFIDDKDINIETARRLGFRVFLYKDYLSLKTYLSECRILK